MTVCRRWSRPIGVLDQLHVIWRDVGLAVIGGLEQVFNLHHAVNRRCEATTNIGHNVFHRPQILVEYRRLHLHPLELPQFAQGNADTVLRLNEQITQSRDLGTLRQRHLDHDIDRLVAGALFHVADHHATQRHGQVLVDGIHRDAAQICLVPVDHETPVIMWRHHVVVHIHKIGGLLEKFGQICRHLAAGGRIRAVNRCDHGLQHRRSRRHFHHGKLGERPRRILQHFLYQGPGFHGDLVTGTLAMVFVEQLNLHFRLPGLLAQIVMAHHAIEVERFGGAHIHLHRCHFREFPHQVGYLIGTVGRFGQCGALRHVQHHGVFRLIVQRQHFHHHQFEIEQGAHDQEYGPHRNPEQACLARVLDHGHQHLAENLFELFRFLVLTLFRHYQIPHGWAEHRMYCQPGCKHECGEQRNHHGHGTQRGDGHHVGSHHAGYETHGKQCADNRQGRQYGGIAHFAHRIDGGFCIRLSFFEPAAVDILHDHDGIIHQDTDGEDQGEQGYPVDGETQHPGTKNREQQYHGYDQQHHDRRL